MELNYTKGGQMRLIAVSLIAVCGVIQDSQNLIEDSSFEKAPVRDGVPSGWNRWSSDGSKYMVSVVEGGRGGKRSLQVAGQGQEIALNSKRVAVFRGERYVLSGYARVEGDKTARATIQFVYWSKDDQWVGNTTFGEARSDGAGWQLLATVSALEKFPKAASMNAALVFNSGGKVWFDDLALTKIQPAGEGNLIPNADLEAWVDDNVVCWFKGFPKDGKIALGRGDEKAVEGSSCLRMSGQSPWASANSATVQLDKAKRYRATAFVRVRKGTAQLQIGYFDGGKWIGSSDTASVAPGGWTGLMLDADLSKFENTAWINVAVVASGGDFDVLVDDVTLVERAGK